MARFCPRCGKETKEFIDRFCTDCYIKMNELSKVPKKITIIRCPQCRLWLVNNKEIEPSLELLVKLIKPKITTQLTHPHFEFGVNDNIVKINIRGKLKNKTITEDHETKIMFKDKMCELCLRESSNYYEYIIQLRKTKNNPNNELYDIISRRIEKETKQLMKNELRASNFWSKKEKEGIDYYFGFAQIGEHVLKNIRKKYKLTTTESTAVKGLDKSGKRKKKHTSCIRV